MSSEQTAFAEAVGALRPYLAPLVVVGGWAHRLYRLTPGAVAPPFPPLMTDDADIATPHRVAIAHKSIGALLGEAGFEEVLAGDEAPPVAYYVKKTDVLELEIEFIANKTGSGVRRDGQRDVTTTVAGVVAQKLPYVDLLLVSPWVVTLDETVGYPVPGGAAKVQIANPASYVLQKLMVLDARTASGKGGKDLLYVYDTLRLLSDSLGAITISWQALSSKLRKSELEHLRGVVHRHFTPTSDNVVSAAQMARATGRPDPPSAALIAATCRAGFTALSSRAP
ncbi:MAG: hypothetical protein JST00_12570 [Deltaproteobacteria bacterium]|nr:hypothetical protein [Deltaproteobacteria bacterium]